VVGDFNADGRPDLATTAQQAHALRVFLGRGPETLAADGSGFLGRARGNISDNADQDYYSFSAKAGDRVFVSSETPNHAGSTGVIYRVYRPEGDEITSMNGANGTDQTQFVAPVTGIYYVRAEHWYDYYGEYRFMVAVVPGTFGLESEGNDSAGAADALAFTQVPGSRSATMG